VSPRRDAKRELSWEMKKAARREAAPVIHHTPASHNPFANYGSIRTFDLGEWQGRYWVPKTRLRAGPDGLWNPSNNLN
jgi:hypothetical protein